MVVAWAIASFLCVVSVHPSAARAGETFTGAVGAFNAVLDTDYPDDHLNFLESSYPSEADRAAKAARLGIVEIMLLDEVLQAGEDDAACGVLSARGSESYEECMSQLYQLPGLLRAFKVDDVCRRSLAVPERVTCLLLLETVVRARRSAMQTHPTWSHKQLELDKMLVTTWREDGQPNASAWHRYPKARELAELDSLLLYVHALDFATAAQAAAIYSEILKESDPYVLGIRAEAPFPDHEMANRRARMQGIRNRFVAPWRALPRVSMSANQGGTAWQSNYTRWILDSRFGVSGYGMGLAQPSTFNLRPPQPVEMPDVAEPNVKDDSSSEGGLPQPTSERTTSGRSRPMPILWVRGGTPIRIPPRSAAVPAERPKTNEPPEQSEGPDPAPVVELQEVSWPDVLVPLSVSECEVRWQPFKCAETTEEDVIAYAAESANETLGTPALVAQASPIEKVKVLGKRLSFVLGLSECGAHLNNDDVLAAAGACFSLIPGVGTVMGLNPRWKEDLPGLKRRLNAYREQALARQRLRELDEVLAGQRELERNVVATRELRNLAESTRE